MAPFFLVTGNEFIASVLVTGDNFRPVLLTPVRNFIAGINITGDH
jgi:hypothetical protein